MRIVKQIFGASLAGLFRSNNPLDYTIATNQRGCGNDEIV